MATSAGTQGSVGLVETSRVVLFTEDDPLVLDSGATLAPVEVAYETYGTLNADRSNAVFVCHALTGDAHAAGHHGDPSRVGWWDTLIGPGKAVDTERFFVVSANLLGGCQGTTGPASTDPATGGPYGLRFPLFTVSDLVRVHRQLLAHLGIETPRRRHRRLARRHAGAAVGDRPSARLRAGLMVCSSARLTAQNIAFSAVARAAIMGDEHFHGGDYYRFGERPAVGPRAGADARPHHVPLEETSMRQKFGRRIQRRGRAAAPASASTSRSRATSSHQGESFLNRFDANSYLYLTRVMDYFDPFARPAGGDRAAEGDDDAVPRRLVRHRLAVRHQHSLEIVRVLQGAQVPVTFREISRRTATTRSCCRCPSTTRPSGRSSRRVSEGRAFRSRTRFSLRPNLVRDYDATLSASGSPKTSTRLRPRRFARYIVASALRMMSSAASSGFAQ